MSGAQQFMPWPTRGPDGGPLRLFEVGYRGRSVESIAMAVRDVDGCLIDVRMHAPPARPFSPSRFKALLGERYAHVRWLGNRNFRGGPIVIHDPTRGVRAALDVAATTGAAAMALMCACERFDLCHRKTVADLIAREIPGAAVIEALIEP